ncbi:unnamed protein product [Rotaria sp. Silwood1]|nr:unnamed protein product [Rotaria sp. Silwood1]CAF4712337.1 unnamed protein product [Rotaria sp. Silwood1]
MAEDNSMKLRSLEIAMEQIEKDHGKGAVMKLGDKPIAKLEAISTGSISLDSALGIGGVPRGRIIEIYGPESSGKTTVCLHIIAEAMRNGGLAAFIDTEHALDTGYAQKLGVDVGNLLISQPEYGEQALEICETLVRSNALDVIVVDSVAALTPRAEIEGEMGDAVMGMQARLMSQALRKLTAAVSKSNVVLIFTNQLREKIGVMFGSPETTTGGSLLTVVFNYKNPMYVAVGASGAISGVVFAYVLLFPMSQIGVLFIPMPAFVFAFLYIGVTIWGVKSKFGNIGHEAHLGGAIGGVISTIILIPDAPRIFLANFGIQL